MKVLALCLGLCCAVSVLQGEDCLPGYRWFDAYASCQPLCDWMWVGDGNCDADCYQSEFEYDRGDCGTCQEDWQGDGYCDFLCDLPEFEYDKGDCSA